MDMVGEGTFAIRIGVCEESEKEGEWDWRKGCEKRVGMRRVYSKRSRKTGVSRKKGKGVKI